MRRLKPLLGLAGVLAVLATGCAGGHGQTGTDTTDGVHPMTMQERMARNPGMPMGSLGSSRVGAVSDSGPSPTARMVCSEELQRDAAKALGLSSVPPGSATWADQLYTCRYRVPSGVLVLSVKETPETQSGRAYFDGLRDSMGRASTLGGLEAFGLPAFETPDGVVAFLKDGKTLEVDARGLETMPGARGQSRGDVAYALAADVVACWSE